jgi:ubiquinone/menaquinone biosynthesis C-methylase UbiE
MNELGDLKEINEYTRIAYNCVAEKYHMLFQNEMREKPYDRKIIKMFLNRIPRNSCILDAGCGPSGHISAYIHQFGHRVIGVDISDRCVEIAAQSNPNIAFYRMDMTELDFPDQNFDGIISYYSIIDTPKSAISKIFQEYYRVLKSNGYLLIVVKEGDAEGYIDSLLDIPVKIYFTQFRSHEIRKYLLDHGFEVEFIESREPMDIEIKSNRLYAIGKKAQEKKRKIINI